MTETPAAPPTPQDEGIRHYSLLCMAGLGVVALALFLRGLDALALLPALVGGLAMVFRWRSGALLGVLTLVTWLLAVQHWPVLHPALIADEILLLFRPVFTSPPIRRPVRPGLIGAYDESGIADLLLYAGMLVYFTGHYRLLSVARRVFPSDPRKRSTRDLPEDRRSGSLVSGKEVLRALVPLPLWIGLALLCWRWLEGKGTDLDIDDRWWRVMILAWVLGVSFLVAAALVRYAAEGRMRPEEAALFLQDTLWRETSREQRRINRWIAWTCRRQRRKGIES
jgi:hypothetical protein